MQYQKITIYTDGGCSGNPGPGGWAFTLEGDGVYKTEMHGGEKETTNNKMELTAVIQALSMATQFLPKEVDVFTDSQYVKNGITVWIKGWKAKGWRTADKKPVKNKEYWEQLDALVATLPVSFHWVKGHAGIDLNERCDFLVQQAINQYR